jgi:hypothetical protein
MLYISISVPYTQPFHWCIHLTGTKCFIHLPKGHHQVTHSYAEIQNRAITDYSTTVILTQKQSNHLLLLDFSYKTGQSLITLPLYFSYKTQQSLIPLYFSYKTQQSLIPLYFSYKTEQSLITTGFLIQNWAITVSSTTVYLYMNV